MINKVRLEAKKTIQKNKTLFENFISLSLLQGLDYIFPLITLPYLVRVLGPEKYGLTAFAAALVGYFMIITNYGFNYSAVRDIAIAREDEKKTSTVFMSVMIIKIFLLLLSLIIFLGIVLSFQKFRAELPLFLFSFLAVAGNVAFPVWFFQGMEKMKYITIFNIVAKAFFTFLVFLVIKSASDYIYVPLLNSLGIIVSGLCSLFFIFKNFKIRLLLPSREEIKKQFLGGWHFFVSSFFINLYTNNTNTFLLGLLTNNEMVGYFSGAEKIIRAFTGLIAPVSQTVYPHLSRLFIQAKEASLKFIRKLEFLLGGIFLAVSLSLFLFASPIVKIILGEEYLPSISIIRIMAILPLLITMSNVFGVQGLFAFGISQKASKIFITASFLHIPMFILLTKLFSINGSALAVVLTESLVTILCFLYFKNFLRKEQI